MAQVQSGMASSLPSLFGLSKPFLHPKFRKYSHVRAQFSGDEGRSMNIGDENLLVLRERLEVLRMKERLKRCNRFQHGWCYPSGYDKKFKRDAKLSEFLLLLGLVCRNLSLTIVIGSLLLCLASLVIHLNR